MKVFIASDHGGYELKNSLVKNLIENGYDTTDLGPENFDPEDDFPDITQTLCASVTGSLGSCGILLCRNGVGVSIAANKFKKIRCALSFNVKHAQSAKTDDNANVLALPTDYITKSDALNIVLAFLTTPFSNDERFIRRILKVEAFENGTH